LDEKRTATKEAKKNRGRDEASEDELVKNRHGKER